MVRSQNKAEHNSVAPRERILAAARDLFHTHGIRAVGVEAIAEAATTNKAAIYRHFGSKDELVAAYVRALADEGNAVWERRTSDHPGDPAGQIESWLRHVEGLLSDHGERGCALANAAVELRSEPSHPARLIIDAYKQDKRERLVLLFTAAGYGDVERLADEVFLLFEGARINLQCCASGSAPAQRLIGTLREIITRHKPAARTKAAKSGKPPRPRVQV